MPTLRLPYGPDVRLALPSPEQITAAAGNVTDKAAHGRLADLRSMPRELVDEGPQRAVYRYRPVHGRAQEGTPVLLVPPLAAPALAFDLRRGCSLVEHLVNGGVRTYLVDYGSIAFSDRRLGLEHWVDEVLPRAIEKVADDAGEPVRLVAWCLGGIMALLTLADRQDLPVSAVAAIASPFDVTQVPMIAPLRPLALLTGGRLGTVLYRAMGGAPAPLVKRAFQLTSVDKYVTKPLAVATHLDDRDFLEQIEAVDRFTASMLAYPGRTFGQLYHRLFRANDLADGCLALGDRKIDLSRVRVPVLAIAGTDDTIAPVAAVHHLGELLTGSPQVRLETAPGGHLGVLTGRRARATTWAMLDELIRERGTAGRARATPRRRTTNKRRRAAG